MTWNPHCTNEVAANAPRSRAGFTLMEVLLVLVILVVLASMAVTMFGGTQEQALKDAAKGQVGIFKSAINLYKFHTRELSRPAWTDLIDKPGDANVGQSLGRAVPGCRQGAARSVGPRIQVRRARQAQRRFVRRLVDRAPTARTAPPTTSATGKTKRILDPCSTHASRPVARPNGLTLVEVMPRARAVGGDRRGFGAAAGRLVLARRPQSGAATCCAARGREARLAAMQSGETLRRFASSRRAAGFRSLRSISSACPKATSCRRTTRMPSTPPPICCGSRKTACPMA